jgi:hypothetical protein
MAPADSWPDGDGLPPPPPPAHQDQLNRQMIRHLMTQYSHEEMQRIWQEETRVAHSDTASVFTSSTRSSVKSEDAISVFDSGSSIRTGSDKSSTRGSIISNVSAKFLSRKSRPSVTSTPAAAAAAASISSSSSAADGLSWDTDDAATINSVDSGLTTGSGGPKQKGTFMCGFCKEEGIQKTCTRKNDLKRHIEDFHNMNAQWFCRHRGCQMVFDWQTAYKTHLKQSHGGSRMSLDDAKVDLCPQTVFACGFDTCTAVLEAPADDDAAATFKEFVAHVVKHFDETAAAGEWTYSARIRNLLRQTGVSRAWNNSSWPEADRDRLTWHPQTSGVLRKRLETRHIGDLQVLIKNAILTGSNPAAVHKFGDDFGTPVRDTCQLMIPGHKIRAPSAGPGPLPVDAEPEFKISRGANPSLAAYLATQRRVYVPRPPVRAGRSARPPVRAMSSAAPMAPQFDYAANPGAPLYDARQQQQQQQQQQQHQQQQQQQQYAVMSHPHHGGIIADDMRSLRSLAGHGPDGDVEMGDAASAHHLVDTSGYMPPHQQPQHGNFSHYGPGAMQQQHAAEPVNDCNLSSTPTGLDQHGQFVPYGATHHTY